MLPRVLLAEDQPINQKIVLKMLQNICAIDIANNGLEAVRKMGEQKDKHKYEAILMDVWNTCTFSPSSSLVVRGFSERSAVCNALCPFQINMPVSGFASSAFFSCLSVLTLCGV
jgi:hypothetical protein